MSQEKTKENHIKQMADLLRQGSTLTNLACPACSSPLFKLKSSDLWCAKCQKKVIVIKEGEEPTSLMALDTLEATLLAKMQEIQAKIQHEENIEELQKLSTALSELLENLEKIKKAKKT